MNRSLLIDSTARFVLIADALRDSKLTRILADALGGNANAALLATVGPAPQNQVTRNDPSKSTYEEETHGISVHM